MTEKSTYELIKASIIPAVPRRTPSAAPQIKGAGTTGSGTSGRSLDTFRSLSTPMSRETVDYLGEHALPEFQINQTETKPGFVCRSFSSPEPGSTWISVDRREDATSSRRNSEPVYEMSSLHCDSEQNKGFDNPLLSMHDELVQPAFRSNQRTGRGPMPETAGESSGLRRIVTASLPGSGLHRVDLKKQEPGIDSNGNKMMRDRSRGRTSARKVKDHFSKALIPSRPLRLMMPHSENTSDFDRELGLDFSREMTLDPGDMDCLDLQMREARPASTIMAIEETDEECNDQSDSDKKSPEFGLDGGPGLMATKHNGSAANADVTNIMDNLKKTSPFSRQNQAKTINQTQVTSSSSQMVSSTSTASSSSSSQRMQSSASRVHHLAASELKASSMKSDLTELKSSISEMKNLSSAAALNFNRLRSSMENIVDSDELSESDMHDMRDIHDMHEMGDSASPLVTFPDSDTPPPIDPNSKQLPLVTSGSGAGVASSAVSTSSSAASAEAIKYEAARMTSASSTRVVADGYSAESRAAASQRMRRVRAGAHLDFSERSATGQSRRRVETEGLMAEQNAAYLQEQRSLKAGDVQQQEANNIAASSMKLHTDTFSSEKKAMASQQARQTVTASGLFSSQEKHVAHQSNMTITSKNSSSMSSSSSKSMLSTAQMSQLMNGAIKPGDEDLSTLTLDDLDRLSANSNPKDVENAIAKYSGRMDAFIRSLKQSEGDSVKNASAHFNKLNEVMRRAWAVPTYGHELGYTLCNTLRNSGGLDLLMNYCLDGDGDLQFSSAKLLEQCLTTENRAHVVENGLEKVVRVACVCTKNANSVDHSRVGTGILEHLFKHSEGTCSDVIKLGGLDAVLFECRKNDVETLRHCAGALANLSLYGGAENQEAMIKRKVPMWLFPLAFHNDDNIKYYACLAIAVLVANKEIEAAVLKSGTLDLVEPFVTSHNPFEFARSNHAHAHGQSTNWLQRLVPVLSSKREEARNLAAFHFCMEAGIKKQQGNTEIFREIGAIEPLKKVASCPNAVASKYAAQALRLIGEEVPHKLSQQVPLWSTEDVREWVKQIGFTECANNFVESRVDGDLLLQLTEENLKEDIGLTNGIRRRRFTRELQNLKKMADYSSRDAVNLNSFLQDIGPEYSIYTYSMLNAGVDKDSMRALSDEQLEVECSINNSIHRLRILNSIRAMETKMSILSEENSDKPLDVFVSYRRSNGSQLASLLKVHLHLRGFTVFIDVERLEAGKFDNNLLQSIRQAKHFLLVLTPEALERCVGDTECKDWVHREIVAALQSQCNIIPIIDNFKWPEPEELPEDMRAVCHFNGVRWIHDYQDACVEKLERFMRGELNVGAGVGALGRLGALGGAGGKGDATPSTAQIGRGPPSYQRMLSTDSKGSDKDLASNSSRD